MIGTGNTIFLQFGHVVTGKNHKIGQFQPNFAIQYSDFDALDDSMFLYDIGVNLFFDGHNNKLSLGYQNRPIYNTTDIGEIKVTERKGMVVLQYQLEIN